MSKVDELEKAVTELQEEEYRQFRLRFFQYDWEKWDQQVEADSDSGKLDFLIQEAFDAKRRGELRNL